MIDSPDASIVASVVTITLVPEFEVAFTREFVKVKEAPSPNITLKSLKPLSAISVRESVLPSATLIPVTASV